MSVRGRTTYLHGFTLIELLVVVAIIAVLMALLLPALNRARDSAKAVVCLSNQHQCGMGLLAYSVDHRGKVAVQRTMQLPGNSDYRYWTWFHVSGHDAMNNTGYPTTVSTDVIFCPATPTYATAIANHAGGDGRGGYAMYLVGSGSPSIVRNANFQMTVGGDGQPVDVAPSRFIYQQLARLPYGVSSMIWLADSLTDPAYYPNGPVPARAGFTDNGAAGHGGRIHLLHPGSDSGTVNVLFYDGHTGNMTSESGSRDFPVPYRKYFDINNQPIDY